MGHRHGWVIVVEYADAVESAKDEDRPDFQRLLYGPTRPDRAWSLRLAVDTSRLSKDPHFAQVCKHQLAERGGEIHYSKLPSNGSAMDKLFESIMEAMDPFHSLMSREKGCRGKKVSRAWPRTPATDFELAGEHREVTGFVTSRREATEKVSRF